MFRKITIYGAGAIGGWLGAGLAAAGRPINAVARGATLAALQQHGLRLREGNGADERERAFAVNAVDQPSALGAQDLVVVAVKAPGLPDVAAMLADQLAAVSEEGLPGFRTVFHQAPSPSQEMLRPRFSMMRRQRVCTVASIWLPEASMRTPPRVMVTSSTSR